MKKWFLAAIALPLLGCANPALTELNHGTFCSSENVQAYAKKHHVTYEQALEALRREADVMWAEQEAKQANRTNPKETLAGETSAGTATR